eukprot:CAMPEP_0197049232 /NCGR_PEP_ID=MMETSP1384-20130603/24412_1 /TAXON_ID=29189 /ORGANISM="Ammonia sp." /LENGTH=564 /DNA_ID=CAMNT_0042481481 /DNA_START=76 /DNA_END=1770 /DNA_ORIENTATION=+
MEVDDVTDTQPANNNNNNNNWAVDNVNKLDLGNANYNYNHNNNNTANDDNINYILCPMCQTPIKPNAVNLCMQCLNSRFDITAGISRELVIFQCRQCERWYKNPQWISAELESANLLELLLKKVSGISKREVKLVNAAFVWTEPHSKRLRIKLTIQKEVMSNAIIEKSFEVSFIIENQQCRECQASFTHHTWKASIQLRQKVNHKRTFLFLEQLILKFNMAQNCIGIKEQRDGIDFYFASKSAAQTFMSFLQSVICCEKGNNLNSKRLISHDHKSNVANFKYTMNAELPPVCRNDLCLIPLKLQKRCGGHSPLMICYKITTWLHLVDPISLHTIELDSKQYFRYYFKPISSVQHLTVFYVMAITPKKNVQQHGKWKCAEVELVRENDLGDDTAPILDAVTHLGGLLKEGDMVMGYDLHQLSTHDDLIHDANLKPYLKRHKMPDVIIVKKHYPYYSKATKRKWKLKSMVKERDYNVDKYAAEREQRDNEEFMRDIEQDFELRCQVKVYKDPNAVFDESEVDPEVPHIPDHELLDEFAEMKLQSDDKQQNNDEENDNDDEDMACID